MGDRDFDATVIRAAISDDAEGIGRVHATSWRETYGRLVNDSDINPWFDIELRVSMWRSNLADVIFTTAVASDETGIIGFATVQATAEAGAVRPEELTMLYVLAHAHGSGVGQKLLEKVLGERPASLWVTADNPRAHSFYRRNRFVADGATSSFRPDPNHRETRTLSDSTLRHAKTVRVPVGSVTNVLHPPGQSAACPIVLP